MIIFKIYLIGFFLINFLIFLIVKKSKPKADPILEQIKAVYPIVKIKKDLFYFKRFEDNQKIKTDPSLTARIFFISKF